MKGGHQGDSGDGTEGGERGKGEEILHTCGQTDQLKVLQEVLENIKSYGREGSRFLETTFDLKIANYNFQFANQYLTADLKP